MMPLLFHLMVYVIFRILSLLSFKKQQMYFFLCYHHTFNKQWIFFPYVVTVVYLAVEVILHMFSALSLKKQYI